LAQLEIGHAWPAQDITAQDTPGYNWKSEPESFYSLFSRGRSAEPEKVQKQFYCLSDYVKNSV